MSILMWILLGAAVVIGGWAIWAYNRFISFENRVEEAWADIDVQLKRRYDLIPNLIDTVKGYAKHEKETFERVTQMRAQAMEGGGDAAQQAQQENMLTDALKSLFAVAENYPDLKANENFLELQRELTDTENKIQAARRFYNGNVRDMNTALETFPQNIIGSAFSFTQKEYFELEEESDAREPVDVNFGTEGHEAKKKQSSEATQQQEGEGQQASQQEQK
jgi:LemA protein